MNSKFQQNAIITGYINAFCLVCDCNLDSQAVALWHIDQYEHVKNLEMYPYLKKYRNDGIRKVKYGYFCESCNMLLSTSIDEHTGEIDHYENALYKSLQRVNGSVLAFDQIIINEKAWHSLTEKSCALCNMEFENEEDHMSDETHALKLVQSKVESREEGVYRMVYDSTIQCLTCNILLPFYEISHHFKSDDHKKIYTGSLRRVEDKDKALIEGEAEEIEIKMMEEQHHFVTHNGLDPSDDLENTRTKIPTKSDPTLFMYFRSNNGGVGNACSIKENRQSWIKSTKRNSVDVLKNKKQDEETSILIVHNAVERQLTDMEKAYENAQQLHPGGVYHRDVDIDSSPQEFALQSSMIVIMPQATHVHCKLCMTEIPFSMDDMIRHSITRKHRALVVHTAYHEIPLNSFPRTYPARHYVPFRIPMIDFVFNSYRYGSDSSKILLNRTYNISVESFNLIYHVSKERMLCHVCRNIEPFDNLDAHLRTSPHHIIRMNLSLVLAELPKEFIREISTNKYHCGFCNVVIPSLRDLKDHLNGNDHEKCRFEYMYNILERPVGLSETIATLLVGRELLGAWLGTIDSETYY